jgi:hypothetical protein
MTLVSFRTDDLMICSNDDDDDDYISHIFQTEFSHNILAHLLLLLVGGSSINKL